VVVPSHRRKGDSRLPVLLGGSANTSRDQSLEGVYREESRRPGLALGAGPARSGRGGYFAMVPVRPAQPTSLRLLYTARAPLSITTQTDLRNPPMWPALHLILILLPFDS
jgi:hypothetical protein